MRKKKLGKNWQKKVVLHLRISALPQFWPFFQMLHLNGCKKNTKVLILYGFFSKFN